MFWVLKKEDVKDADQVAAAVDMVFQAHPHWRTSDGQDRSVRTSFYKALIEVGASAVVDLVDKVLKVRRELRSGDELYKSLNKWVKKEREIDRDRDYYKEKVTDAETGEIIHECEESLSQHFGHGSRSVKKN